MENLAEVISVYLQERHKMSCMWGGKGSGKYTAKQEEAIQAARKGDSVCSDHLADQGIINRDDTGTYYARFRRIAEKEEIDPQSEEGWLSKLGTKILHENQ